MKISSSWPLELRCLSIESASREEPLALTMIKGGAVQRLLRRDGNGEEDPVAIDPLLQ